jgi:hypothetical protein
VPRLVDFKAEKATKLQLRRWLSLYNVSLPPTDVKKQVLLGLWSDHIESNQLKLKRTYHRILFDNEDPPPLSDDWSPIHDVTPARIHAVEVSASAQNSISEHGMFRRSKALQSPGTPTPFMKPYSSKSSKYLKDSAIDESTPVNRRNLRNPTISPTILRTPAKAVEGASKRPFEKNIFQSKRLPEDDDSEADSLNDTYEEFFFNNAACAEAKSRSSQKGK